MKRVYGWRPDGLDFRDFHFKRVTRKKIPDKVDLRPLCPPIEQQGSLGSCTANAGIAILEYLELKNDEPFYDKSRLFLYYNTRILEGTVNEDSGASIRNTIKAMAKWGTCPEETWPYEISKFRKKPPWSCYEEGQANRVVEYQRLYTIDDMLGCLADGFPFEFGFSVYTSFESDEVTKTGIVPMPKKDEELLGGHAVVGVGYDRKEKVFIVRNSWGEWGMSGYCLMPFEYLENRDLSDDFWKVMKET